MIERVRVKCSDCDLIILVPLTIYRIIRKYKWELTCEFCVKEWQ